MTESITPTVLGEALNAVEDRELPLLAWGVVDRDLTEPELLEAVAQRLEDIDLDFTAEEIVDALVARALLVDVGEGRWRSRFAETLRLLTHARQLFGTGAGEWWLRGRRLVADYRVIAQPRRYPRRNLPLTNLIDRVRDVHPLTAIGAQVLAAQIGDNELAAFQVDATAAVLRSLHSEGAQAVIVAAGTGSGKTLAFYLPAYLWMAERPTTRQVHTLAVYPRNELLKDQVGEALRSSLDMASALRAAGRRPLRIGALYGDTPESVRAVDSAPWLQESWRRVAEGRICPYCRCPRCGAELVWPDADRTPGRAKGDKAGRERLVCRGCGGDVSGDLLALTRTSMLDSPPDVLFTTTEMLNRASSDPRLGALFGFTPNGSHPRLLLLDEVHTYQGVHGAHVGLTLRRWRNAVGPDITVVGLSATLADAGAFMARLVGVAESDVSHIEPADDDLIAEGRQYQVAVRADPTSGASMLSLTIQASMLLGRALDPTTTADGLAGSKGFLFTDDLDVTNRLFHDLRDAEGDGWTARRRSGAQKVLANLRSAALPNRARRDADGQVWALADRTGHQLPGTSPARGLRIGKTSSQDPGVADDADLVVATASLDVGFNDPRVGLILQHKSPRDPAQFVQRRGRAGRTRAIRPLTVVTLSDFGRDRLTYQAYDRLFDPELPPRSLPIGNRYVVRMQATFALADWLTRQLRWRVDARRILTPKHGLNHPARDQVAALLEQLLTDPLTQREFAEHLRWSLQLDEDEVSAVFWDPPRALLTAVVPTLLRRVRSNWSAGADDPGGVGDAFAPEFVPRALFAALNLPEVELLLPASYSRQVDTRMPVLQALRETAPGRVSKRFAVRSGAQRTWVPIPLDTVTAAIPLRDFVERGSLEGRWTDYRSDEQFIVVRPYAIRLGEPLAQVADTANSRPVWRTQIVPQDGTPFRLEVPAPWSQYVEYVSVHTHVNRRPLQVRRFTPGARADMKTRGRSAGAAQVRLSYVNHAGEAAALGFALDVDGVHFRLRLPPAAELAGLAHLSSPAWRSLSFRHAVACDESVPDPFVRSWLGPVFESAVVHRVLAQRQPVDDVCADVSQEDLRGAVGRLTGLLTGEVEGPAAGTREDLDDDPEDDPRQLRAKLLAAVADPTVRQGLRDHARRLHAAFVGGTVANAPSAAGAGASADANVDLARHVLARTIGAAIHSAVLQLTPDADDQDLLLDVRVNGGGADIWLTESTVGGAGIVERLVRTYAADPRRFWRLVRAGLGPGDFEVVDNELRRLLDEVVTTPTAPLARALSAVRAARDNSSSRTALQSLLAELDRGGYLVSHPVVSAIAIRLLRPGTGPRHDAALLHVLKSWDEAARTVGFEIDARTWSALMLAHQRGDTGDVYRTPDHVYSSLWPRGVEIFNGDLQVFSPYDDLPPPIDRQLVAALLDDDVPEVSVADPDWRAAFEREITSTGMADLVASTESVRELQSAVIHLSTEPIDTSYLFVHPVVRGARRESGQIKVRLELREMEQ
ncbi:protein DpdJ [Micromonospora sp. 050-3]|uniref:protein DpdJ n=1 Tax=Micromonospora sp. 050-3 TaxID=2789265 RepID=UPI003979507D